MKESPGGSDFSIPDFKVYDFCQRALTVNERLIKEHNYHKMTPHLDLYRLTCAQGYLPIEEFGKIFRKYTVGSNVDKSWAILFRNV